MWVQSMGRKDPLEEDTTTHSGIVAISSSHAPGREAALAWASLAQRSPASSVLARDVSLLLMLFLFLHFSPHHSLFCSAHTLRALSLTHGEIERNKAQT